MMRGQSLIEVLIAFGVTVILGVALISAGLVTQRSSVAARNNAQATKLAQEYIEQIRVIRDVRGFSYLNTNLDGCSTISATGSDPSAWTVNRFITGVPGGGGCSADLADGESVNLPDSKAIFRRDVEIPTGTPTKVIKVTVSWTEGTSTRSVKLETVLSEWAAGEISP